MTTKSMAMLAIILIWTNPIFSRRSNGYSDTTSSGLHFALGVLMIGAIIFIAYKILLYIASIIDRITGKGKSTKNGAKNQR